MEIRKKQYSTSEEEKINDLWIQCLMWHGIHKDWSVSIIELGF